MKKNRLLSVLTWSFLIFVVLCWIIPAGSFSSGEYAKVGISPLGIFDFVNEPLSTIYTFFQYGMLILAIGGLYGVLKVSGLYDSIAEKWATKFAGKENRFLVITIILFSVLASLTGANYAILVLVPLFLGVLTYMNYDKLTMLSSTIGAMLIGNIASTYGFDVVGYINYYFQIDNMHNLIAYKIILLVVLTGVLCFFVIKRSNRVSKEKINAKKDNAKMKIENKKVEKKSSVKESSKKNTTKKVTSKTGSKKNTSKKGTTKKGNKKSSSKRGTKALAKVNDVITVDNSKSRNTIPFMIIFLIAILFLLVACYNWRYSFDVTLFEDAYEAVNGFNLNIFGEKIAIFAGMIGGINPLGYWSVGEISVILVYLSIIIGWVYGLKFKDVVAAFLEGAKKVIPAAFYVTVSYTIVSVLVNTQSNGNIFFTIANWLLSLTKGFNIFTTGILSFIGGFFLNDMPYLVSFVSTVMTTKITDSTLYPLIGLVMQSMHGLAMLVLPTSAILIAGLSGLEVSYKEWIKYIWKFLISVLVIVLAICFICALFI